MFPNQCSSWPKSRRAFSGYVFQLKKVTFPIYSLSATHPEAVSKLYACSAVSRADSGSSGNCDNRVYGVRLLFTLQGRCTPFPRESVSLLAATRSRRPCFLPFCIAPPLTGLAQAVGLLLRFDAAFFSPCGFGYAARGLCRCFAEKY